MGAELAWPMPHNANDINTQIYHCSVVEASQGGSLDAGCGDGLQTLTMQNRLDHIISLPGRDFNI